MAVTPTPQSEPQYATFDDGFTFGAIMEEPKFRAAAQRAHRAWMKQRRAGIDCSNCGSRLEREARANGDSECFACQADDPLLGWGR